MMNIFLPLIALAVSLPSGSPNDQAGRAPTPVAIFDGRTFEGWEGDLKIFRIEEGAIVGGSLKEKIVRNEFLCTRSTYGDFELRLKVKLLGGDAANGGVQFRTTRIPNDHEVSGYQADMGTGWWGALYDESRRKKVLTGPDQATMKGVVKNSEWNDYVIRAEGKHIQFWINGVQTADYIEEDPRVETNGVVCLQIHGGPPAEAWYKDITIVDQLTSSGPAVRAAKRNIVSPSGDVHHRADRVYNDLWLIDCHNVTRSTASRCVVVPHTARVKDDGPIRGRAFCAQVCKQRFDQNPQAYIGRER